MALVNTFKSSDSLEVRLRRLCRRCREGIFLEIVQTTEDGEEILFHLCPNSKEDLLEDIYNARHSTNWMNCDSSYNILRFYHNADNDYEIMLKRDGENGFILEERLPDTLDTKTIRLKNLKQLYQLLDDVREFIRDNYSDSDSDDD